jgi:hypothetical protein
LLALRIEAIHCKGKCEERSGPQGEPDHVYRPNEEPGTTTRENAIDPTTFWESFHQALFTTLAFRKGVEVSPRLDSDSWSAMRGQIPREAGDEKSNFSRRLAFEVHVGKLSRVDAGWTASA